MKIQDGKELEGLLEICNHVREKRGEMGGVFKDLMTFREKIIGLKLSSLEPESSQKIQAALEKCAESIGLLQSEEARKLWSQLLTSEEMSSCVHAGLKNLMPSVTKKDGRIVGDIYYKAWKSGGDESSRDIIHARIQDLMHGAVLAKNRSLTDTLRTIIGVFAEKKEMKEVQQMLLELLNPILWRQLGVPNAHVRRNSAKLLFLVFPLRNPDAMRAEQDELLNQQCERIESLRQDDVPSIRAMAILESFKICNFYWNALPSEFLTNTFMSMQKQHAHDKTSPDSRVAVYCGLRILVDNPRSHPAIKKLLGSTAIHGINDMKDKVRLAAFKVLLKLRGLKTIKFWEVIEMKEICNRLGVEKSTAVRRAIVELIGPSYCPRDKSLDERLQRILAFHNPQFPSTSRHFFKHIHEFLPFDEAVLQLQLMTQGVLAITRQMRDEDPDSSVLSTVSGEGDADMGSAGVPQAVRSPDTVRILLDNIAVMLIAMGSLLEKPENAQARRKTFVLIGKAVQTSFSLFEDEMTIDALLTIGSHLPPNVVPYISKQAIKKLKIIDDDEADGKLQAGTESLIQAISFWKGSELLEMIQDWLEGGWSDSQKHKRISAVDGKRKVKFARVSEPEVRRPFLGMKYLECALNQPVSRQCIIEQHRPLFRNLLPLLSSAKNAIRGHLLADPEDNPSDFPDNKEQLTLIGSLRLSFVSRILSSDESEEEAESLSEWASEQFMWIQKILEEKQFAAFSLEQKEFGSCVFKVLLELGYHLLILNESSGAFVESLKELCSTLLNSCNSFELRSELGRVVYQLCLKYSAQEDCVEQCSSLVQNLLLLLSRSTRSENLPSASDYGSEFGEALRHLLVLLCVKYPDTESRADFAEKTLCWIVGACLAETVSVMAKETGIRSPTEEEFEYAGLTEFLLKHVIVKDRTLCSDFLSAMGDVIESGGVDRRPELALARYGAVLQMLFIFNSGIHRKQSQEVAALINQRIEGGKDRFDNDEEQMAELTSLMNSLIPPSRAKVPPTPILEDSAVTNVDEDS